MALEKMYTTKEIAQDIFVGISAYELSRKCLQGRIPGAKKFGKQWLIPESTLKAMLQVTK